MKFYEKASAVAVTAPILVSALGGAAQASDHGTRKPTVFTYQAESGSTSGVTTTAIYVQTPATSVIPLTVQTFIPAPSIANEEEVDYFDIDFGEPDPFVVPESWLEQFSNVNPDAGLRGSILEDEQ